MKIEYRTPAGSGAYSTLADESTGSLAERITGFLPSMRAAAQVEQLAFANGAFVAGRGNATWTLKFGVDRIHASADAAASFLATHAAFFGVFATFDVRVTVGGTVLTLGNAAITEFTPKPQSDQSTFIQYEFAGGSYG